ncbi:DUF7344 domain-containing protein [Halobacterium zhouii]|uniref:DUF7344 domain-containing protein n=1 Tax=Halobacterium zhouii TaxID=2902624 RepID=UPI001E3D5C5F|nr:hypothetical protein [Halobacterium zhouii]
MSTQNLSSAEPVEPGSDPATTEQSDDQAATESTEQERLSLDIVFEILRNERRRLVLHYLRDNDGEATLGQLAEHIAALENDITVTALNAQQRKRVYVGLYQCHLPKMDDAGVIDFNQSRGTIDLCESADRLETYLDTEDDEARITDRHYLSLAGGSALVYTAALLAAGTLAATVATFLVIGAFVALAGADRHYSE